MLILDDPPHPLSDVGILARAMVAEQTPFHGI
jgi:hypothetical protein